MDRFTKLFLFLLLILLLFSCSAHKKVAYNNHTPPPQTESSNQRKIIVQYAIKSLGLPYKWGGQSPETGFDCSGLSTYTHKKAGIIIRGYTKYPGFLRISVGSPDENQKLINTLNNYES